MDGEGSFLSLHVLFEGKIPVTKLEGVPLKIVGINRSWQKSKMAAVGGLENSFFNGLA